MYGLSQTKVEKKKGVMRVSVVGDRDNDFSSDAQVIFLQQRTLGQIMVDTEILESYTKSDEEKFFSDVISGDD